MRFESEGSFETNHGRPLPEPGMVLGHLKLVSRIGRGGMGDVWKAFDSTRDAHVALKFLPPEVQDSSREMRRVQQTFRAVQALQHPHICPVYFLEEFPGFGHVLGMKCVDGITLLDYRDQYVDEHGGFPVEEVVRVLWPVAKALDYAHNPSVVHPEVTKAVVHRDIKPENILISPDGRGVQIVDFGLVEQLRMSLAKVSQVQMESSGTRPYMSPEQWRGDFQDGHTDQYALAVVAFELLADRLPFEVADSVLLKDCVLNGEIPTIPGVSNSINAILHRGLAKAREDRFATCSELIAGLASSNDAGFEPSSDMDAEVRPAPTGAVGKSAPPRPSSGSKLVDRVRDAQSQVESTHQETRRLAEELYDYAAAVEVLERLPAHLREGDLYSDLIRKRDRTAELDAEIVAAVDGMRFSGLRRKVVSLSELQPQRSDLHELLKTLPLEAPPLLVAPFGPSDIDETVTAWSEFRDRPSSFENSIGMQFQLIPAGEFQMGAPQGEEDADGDEQPQHSVRITRPFYLGIYPVTQAEYQKVMGKNPSHFSQVSGEATGRFPVERVNWEDAQEFLSTLGKQNGETGRTYRLPTEAEWEYACRAGTASPFWFGEALNGTQANCDGNNPYKSSSGPYLKRPSVVGSYGVNRFGLSDTHGNVWEWCGDWYGESFYANSPTDDPVGASSGSSRVLRGGSWYRNAASCRCADRARFDPAYRNRSVGFRVLCEL